jgi:hypothetical protein
MNRSVSAVVLTKQNLVTPAGERLQLTFETKEGRSITIRSPLEDIYLANLQPQDRVFFHRDYRGCHHLDRQPSWNGLFRWSKLPSYASAH